MQFSHFQFLWISLVGIFLSIIFLILTYRYIRREVSSRAKIILIILRTLAIGLLLFCLLEPMLVAREKVFPSANLLVAVDTSQSMSINDVATEFPLGGEVGVSRRERATDGKMSRIDLIADLLSKQDGGFLTKLADRFDLHFYTFDSECKRVDLSSTNTKNERRWVSQPNLTDIGNAISSATKDWRGQPVAGLVLLTDGNHNVGTAPTAIAKNLDVPIYAIGVGDEHPPKDVKFTKVKAEPVVYVGHTFPIEVVFESNGYNGDKIQIQLLREDSIVDVTSATLDDSNPIQTVKFEVNLEEEGNFRYTASISHLQEELTYKNNQRVFFVKSIKAKLRVFYLESRPRWEYSFLKRALERDANIEADCAILSGKSTRQLSNTLLAKTDRYYPQSGQIDQVEKFPSSGLNSYDVLIFGDISPKIFTRTQILQIKDFVEKHGKTVFFLAGRNSLGRNGFVNSDLEELLPVTVLPNRIHSPAAKVVDAFVREINFNPTLTYEGLHHPITRLENTPMANKLAWRNLPPLSRFYAGLRLRAGATVLAEYNPRLAGRNQQTQPIIVFQRYGAGKTLLIAVDDLWGWAFGTEGIKNEAGDLYYSKLWAQAIRWMATRSDAKLVNLEIDKPSYNLGDEVKITVYVYDESYAPLNDADLRIDVQPPGDDAALKSDVPSENDRLEIRPTADEVDGLYTARFRSSQKGAYKITATASYAGTKLGTDSIEFVAEAPFLEFKSPQQNVERLKTIANLSGGVYLPVAQSLSLPDQIDYELEPVTVTHERTLWDNPIILALAVVILGVEWILRKQKGLV